ncbi:hypothetical protein B484DRAFT_334437 [Ochromonadaceae sp. CCMP2298]|nr:hypothetical protein B484DRAFT_334437 [Ochromonadaceae sp. CCMP2298]
MVRLEDKAHPVCEGQPPFAPHYAYTRSIVDVSKLKEKLLTMPQELWDDERQDGNVRMMRPSHDAWGIKKIVFNFSDDFLLKTLDFPWSQQPEWRELLLPIYESIGVDESRVVRSLLASIPPGVGIPIHHDTGYWVKHTHRCHVAIVTGKEVEFQVGPTPELMQKYLFDEGRVVELNNQAKHSVANSMPTHRVHLIFDYVDDHPVHGRLLLRPGEELHQTRRSIDVARGDVEGGSRRAPTFVIIGAQKCGTTSMYEYLCQHPLVARGRRRETHYFDWRYNHKIADSDAAAHHAYYLNFFYADELAKHVSIVTGESTPSYLLHR